jgi:hypothetical protein
MALPDRAAKVEGAFAEWQRGVASELASESWGASSDDADLEALLGLDTVPTAPARPARGDATAPADPFGRDTSPFAPSFDSTDTDPFALPSAFDDLMSRDPFAAVGAAAATAPPTVAVGGKGRRSPSPVRYVCKQAAGVTLALDPGPSPQVIGQYSEGQVLEAREVCRTADGRERVRTGDGWVSCVSASGKVLLSRLPGQEAAGVVATTSGASATAAVDLSGDVDPFGNSTPFGGDRMMSTSAVDLSGDVDPFGNDPFADTLGPLPERDEPFDAAEPQRSSPPEPSLPLTEDGGSAAVPAVVPAAAGGSDSEPGGFDDFLAKLGAQLDELDVTDGAVGGVGGGGGDGSTSADSHSTGAPPTEPEPMRDNIPLSMGNDVRDGGEVARNQVLQRKMKAPTPAFQQNSRTGKQDARLAALRATEGRAAKRKAKSKARKEQRSTGTASGTSSSTPTKLDDKHTSKSSAPSAATAAAASPKQHVSPHLLVSRKRGPAAAARATKATARALAKARTRAADTSATGDAGAGELSSSRSAPNNHVPAVAHKTTASTRGRWGQEPSDWDTSHRSPERSSLSPQRQQSHSSPFTPQLSTRSEKIASARKERLKADGQGFKHTSYHELLYRNGHERKQRTRAKRERAAQQAAADREAAELAQCTFTPKLTDADRKRSRMARLSSSSARMSILERTEQQVRRREEAVAAAEAAKVEAEMASCTFKPSLSNGSGRKSGPSKGTSNKAGKRLLSSDGSVRASGQQRIQQILEEKAKKDIERQRKKEQRDAQLRRLAVPEINHYRPSTGTDKSSPGSPEDNATESDEILPVHERLFNIGKEQDAMRQSMVEDAHRQSLIDASTLGSVDFSSSVTSRAGSPTGSMRSATSAASAAEQNARMEQDIAERRLNERMRHEEHVDAVDNLASTSHTLQNSARLSRAKLAKGLSRSFHHADIEGKGGLTSRQLVSVLRQMRVLSLYEEDVDGRGTMMMDTAVTGGVGQGGRKDEIRAVQLLGYLFDYGGGEGQAQSGEEPTVDFGSFEQLLTRVLHPEFEQVDTEQGSDEKPSGALALLPPDVCDSLVTELQRLHSVNKHAFATGAGGAVSKLRRSAVLDSRRDLTFAPVINARSRQLERHHRGRAVGANETTSNLVSTPSPQGHQRPAAWDDSADSIQNISRHDRLYYAAQASARKREEEAEAAEATQAEREGCTFWPKITTPPAQRRNSGASGANDNRGQGGAGLFDELSNINGLNEEGMIDSHSAVKIRLSRAEKLALTQSTVSYRWSS